MHRINLLLSFFPFLEQINTGIAFLNGIIAPCPLRAPLVVIVVGLPLRGKSLAAHKIARHLCWKGERAKGTFLDLFRFVFVVRFRLKFIS